MPRSSSDSWHCSLCYVEVIVAGNAPPPDWFQVKMVRNGAPRPHRSPRLGVFCSLECLTTGVLEMGYHLDLDQARALAADLERSRAERVQRERIPRR